MPAGRWVASRCEQRDQRSGREQDEGADEQRRREAVHERVPRLLERHGLKVADIDLWELNEAFAAQVLYCVDRLGIPQDRLNVDGGAISIGHPYGMSGARLAMTAVHQMAKAGGRRALATMCVGVGQGVSLAMERV